MAEVPDPFMIRAHVPNWDACVADYRVASAATRATLPARLGVSYGSHLDERLDLFFPDAAEGASADRLRPVHMFVHGGYWRAFSKEDYSFVADSIVAAGAIAAMIDYSLMPGARMATLVGQVRGAARWLLANAAEFGGDPASFSASGHSAGAHLASYLVCRGPDDPDGPVQEVGSVMLLSGLYDLEPVSHSFLQPEVRFTPEEIALWSPMRAMPVRGARVRIAVGARETRPFLEQSQAFAAHLSQAGLHTDSRQFADEDHMSVVRSLGEPSSAVADALTATIRDCRRIELS